MMRAVEVTLEIIFAVALVVGVVIWTLYVPESKWISSKWFGFAGLTGISFGYPIVWFKWARKNLRFWAYLLALAIAHLGLGILVISRVDHIPLILFALAGIPELWIIGSILQPLDRSARTAWSVRKN